MSLKHKTVTFESIRESIKSGLHSLQSKKDLVPLIEKIKDSKIVMLGESSHGTHEFYHWRELISQELIKNHGFNFIAVEGDWPACFSVNQYIRTTQKSGPQRPQRASDVMAHFHRWPTWMWANEDVLNLISWLKNYNYERPSHEQVGFYGLDVYSLFESIEQILQKLKAINPLYERKARTLYECFDPYHHDEKKYARSLVTFPEGCQEQVIKGLHNLLKLRIDETRIGVGYNSKIVNEELIFDIQQNARIVANAEQYYRTLILGNEDSWNVRDRHMMETLDLLLDKKGEEAKAIVWAHNTHIGDYRATDMSIYGQVNLGGLAREQLGEEAVSLVGFGTYQGEVIASHAWDGPMEVMEVPPAHEGTYESLFHEVANQEKCSSFFLDLKSIKNKDLASWLGHRAIGVVYHPAFERRGNYVPTSLSRRYDQFIFIDQTQALVPIFQKFDTQKLPETWPHGL